MEVRLYSLRISNPGHAAEAMMSLKGIEPTVSYMLPGLHHRIMRIRGFSGRTVPAIRLDGRRIQGTREIARALEELVPEPPLFPAEPEARAAVEDAESWADESLQNVPRRIMRFSGAQSQEYRRHVAKENLGVPLPGLAAAVNRPEARRLARVADADEPTVRRELTDLPATIARVDELIAKGVIGGEQPNAADFQIASSVRLLLMLEGVRDLVDGGPAAAHARGIFCEPFGGSEPIPWVLPREWLPSPS